MTHVPPILWNGASRQHKNSDRRPIPPPSVCPLSTHLAFIFRSACPSGSAIASSWLPRLVQSPQSPTNTHRPLSKASHASLVIPRGAAPIAIYIFFAGCGLLPSSSSHSLSTQPLPPLSEFPMSPPSAFPYTPRFPFGQLHGQTARALGLGPRAHVPLRKHRPPRNGNQAAFRSSPTTRSCDSLPIFPLSARYCKSSKRIVQPHAKACSASPPDM